MQTRSILFLCAAALLAACSEPPPVDYRTQYPIQVRPELEALSVHVIRGQVTFPGDEEARFASLVTGYLDRGHGPITVAVGSSAASGGDVQTIRERLIAAGVPASAIRVVAAERGTADGTIVSFERYVVQVPRCGNWSTNTSFDPYNQQHSDFGCAMQRNLGLMVADPYDLVHMRDASATDAQNSSRVLQKYRAGEPPAATQTPLQLKGAVGTQGTTQ